MTKDEIVKALRMCGSNCCKDCVCFKKDIAGQRGRKHRHILLRIQRVQRCVHILDGGV